MHAVQPVEVTSLRKAAIATLLCVLALAGCRGQSPGQGPGPIRREASPPATKAESLGSTTSLGDGISALLKKFQDANARYAASEITKEERTNLAQEMEEEAWSLLQSAKTLADKAARGVSDPKRQAFKQELEVFLMLYLQDLHGALCAERIALQTGKDQWNKRAYLHAKLLASLANSIRYHTDSAISLPGLSPGPGRLPSPRPPSKATTTTTSEETAATGD